MFRKTDRIPAGKESIAPDDGSLPVTARAPDPGGEGGLNADNLIIITIIANKLPDARKK